MTVKPTNTFNTNTANKYSTNRPPPLRHYNHSQKGQQKQGLGTAPPPHAIPWSEEKTSSSKPPDPTQHIHHHDLRNRGQKRKKNQHESMFNKPIDSMKQEEVQRGSGINEPSRTMKEEDPFEQKRGDIYIIKKSVSTGKVISRTLVKSKHDLPLYADGKKPQLTQPDQTGSVSFQQGDMVENLFNIVQLVNAKGTVKTMYWSAVAPRPRVRRDEGWEYSARGYGQIANHFKGGRCYRKKKRYDFVDISKLPNRNNLCFVDND